MTELIPVYAYVVVVIAAVVVGLAVAFLLWYILCRKAVCIDLFRHHDDTDTPITKSPTQSPKNTFRSDYTSGHPLPPKPVKVQPTYYPEAGQSAESADTPPVTGTFIVPIQPTVKSSSQSEEEDARTKRLEERFKQGKVANLTLSAYYKNNELVLHIYQVKEIHSSISIHHAHVEIKLENKEGAKLRTVRLIHKGKKLMGTGQDYRYAIPQQELCNAAFNFYLWSSDAHSRNYQAGICKMLFEGKTEDDFIEGFTLPGDFELSNEDTTGCAKLSLMLRYNNRSGRLIVFIHSIADLPKMGWRRHFNGLVPILGEPSPIVKVELHREGKSKEKEKTPRVQGFNPIFNKTFSFDVPLAELNTVKLVLKIVYSDKVTQDELGVLEFGANSTGSEGEHWREMEQAVSRERGVTKDHYIKQINIPTYKSYIS